MFWLIPILIIAALSVVAAVIAPRPKTDKPPAVTDLTYPTADPNKPMSMIFGTITSQSPNILWYGDKSTKQYEISVSS